MGIARSPRAARFSTSTGVPRDTAATASRARHAFDHALKLAIFLTSTPSMPPFDTTRRGILGLIGSLAIFRGAPRAAVPDTFTLAPRLEAGQAMSWRFEQAVRRNGALAHHSRSQVTLEVLDAVDGGWLARWTTDRSELLDADPRMKPLMALMQDLWDGVPVPFFLDAAGSVAGLADIDPLRERMLVSMARMLDHLLGHPALAPAEPHIRATLEPLMTHDAFLEQSMLKEARILLGAMGREYRVGEPLEVRTRIDSPLGSGEIPVLGRFSIRGVDVRAKRASLGWLMVIDTRSAARTIAAEMGEALEPLAEIADEPVDLQATLGAAAAGLDFDDRGEFEVDTATAWPVQVTHERKVTNAGQSRVDRVEFSRVG